MATALEMEREARLAAVRRRTAIELQRQLDEARPHPFRWLILVVAAVAFLYFLLASFAERLYQVGVAFPSLELLGIR